MFFNLLGRIGLNTKPLEEGLDRAEKKSASFADRVEKKVGKKLDKAFGVGLVTGAVIGQVHQFMDIFKAGPERAAELQVLMDKFHVGAETAQALEMAAKEAGLSIEEFLKKASESGGVDATIKRIQELRKQSKLTTDDVENLGQSENSWSTLKGAVVKGEASLRRGLTESFTLIARQMQLWGEGVNPLKARDQAFGEIEEQKRQDALNRAANNRADDERIKEELAKKKEPTPPHQHRSSSLTPWQSVGAFVGVPGDVISREQQKTNQILQRMETLSREQIAVLRKSGSIF